MNKRGFTLIELIVAVTVIAIMISTTLVAYNQLTVSSRDARRKSDLEIIRAALDQYRSTFGHYPLGGMGTNRACASTASTSDDLLTIDTTDPNNPIATGADGSSGCSLGALVYHHFLDKIPTDPGLNNYASGYDWTNCYPCGCSEFYAYDADATGSTYTLSAHMESQGVNSCVNACKIFNRLQYQYCVGPVGPKS